MGGAISPWAIWSIFIPGDFLDIGDASGEEGHVQMVKCKGKSGRIQEEKGILTALDFVEELIANHRHLELTGNQEANLIKKNAIWMFKRRIKSSNCIG